MMQAAGQGLDQNCSRETRELLTKIRSWIKRFNLIPGR